MDTLVEYEPTLVEMEDRDRNYLIDLVKGSPSMGDKLLESFTPTSEVGIYRVTSGCYVGRLGLPSGNWLDLTSRFDIDVAALVRMIIGRPSREDDLPVPYGAAPALTDAVAIALSREVKQLVLQGLAKGYRERRFDRPPYPGIIDAARHVNRFAGRPDRLTTTAKRLTFNIPINAALSTSMKILRRIPLGGEARAAVADATPSLNEIQLPPPSAVEVAELRTTLNRLTEHYRSALELAEIVLRSEFLGPWGQSHHLGTSMLFSMARIWESYVFHRVKEVWPAGFEVKPGYRISLSSSGEVRATADVVVTQGQDVVALYDAKYKHFNDSPKSADIYQMVTYCECLSLTEATLVVPSTDHVVKELRVGKRRLRTVGLCGPGPGVVDLTHLGPAGLAHLSNFGSTESAAAS